MTLPTSHARLRTRRVFFCTAGAAAGIAVLGDSMMLQVALGYRPFDATGRLWLWIGGAVGAAAIPLYTLGYLAWMLTVARTSATTWSYRLTATSTSVFGALTHALTAADIDGALSSGASTRHPEEAFGTFSALTACGLAAAFSCAATNVMLGRAAARAGDLPLFIGANPLGITVALGLTALGLGSAGQYLGPAAPNVAHLAFFAAGLALLRRSI